MIKQLAQSSANTLNLQGALSGTGFAQVEIYEFRQLVYVALEMILVAAGVGFFFYLILGGIQWIFGGGDKEAVEKARKKITAALIGLAIVLSSYAIATIIDIIFFGGNGGIFVLQIPRL